MARIISFDELEESDRARLHTEVTCTYRVIKNRGETLVQLDTYGSRDRKIPDKTSQSLQIDRQRAQELIRILKVAFPGIS